MIKRKILEVLLHHLSGDTRFIQVLSGPRQVGKTTLAQQAIASLGLGYQYASADDPGTQNHQWIETQWQSARLQQQKLQQPFLLVLDEVQKIQQWSSQVKAFWDEDRLRNTPIKVLILGSAPLR